MSLTKKRVGRQSFNGGPPGAHFVVIDQGALVDTTLYYGKHANYIR